MRPPLFLMKAGSARTHFRRGLQNIELLLTRAVSHNSLYGKNSCPKGQSAKMHEDERSGFDKNRFSSRFPRAPLQTAPFPRPKGSKKYGKINQKVLAFVPSADLGGIRHRLYLPLPVGHFPLLP